MIDVPWGTAAAVFIGTLPLLGVLVWNAVEVKGIRAELVQIRVDLGKLAERIAILEERDRGKGLFTR